MSLIQDALKRQAEETAGMRLPGMPLQPVEPLQQPQQPQQPQKTSPEMKKNKALPVLPFILFLVLFLAALLGLSLYLIKPKLKAAPKVTHESSFVESAASPSTHELSKTLEAPVQAIETMIEPAETPVIEPAVAAESMMKTKKVWPELKLTGIAQADRQRLAILNGKTLAAGRKLGEVTIIQVRDGNIIVEYKGERRILYIGE